MSRNFDSKDFITWCASHKINPGCFIMRFDEIIFIAAKHTTDKNSLTFKLIKKIIESDLNPKTSFIIEGLKAKNGINYKTEMNDSEMKYAYDLLHEKKHKYDYYGIEDNKKFIKKIKANKLDIATWFYVRDVNITNFADNIVLKTLNSNLGTSFKPTDIENKFYEIANVRQNPIVIDVINQYQVVRNKDLFNAIKPQTVIIFGYEHAYQLYELLVKKYGIPKFDQEP